MSPTPASPLPRSLVLLLIVFILLGTLYAVTTPLFEISDELWHYPMVKYLADGNGLPVQDPAIPTPWRQEGSQPPLYYAVMALATRWIDTSDLDQVRWLNPHVDNGLITEDRNNNIVIHTSRERAAWPWRGTVLAVRLIRLLSVLLGAGTVYFTYRLALELVPGQLGLALAAAGFTAFTPMFLFISASVNNDNLAIVCSAWALWLMARWLRGPLPTFQQCALMGAILAGAALSKVSALGLFPIAGAVLLFSQFRYGGPLTRNRLLNTLYSLCLTFGVALLFSGWWYWRNYQLYGDWLGWNRFIDIVGRRPHPATLMQLWGERVGFVQAYWGLFGGVSVPMPGWTYTVLNAVTGIALIGLGWAALRVLWTARAGGPRVVLLRLQSPDALVGYLLVTWIILLFVGLVRWTSLTWASQGRLIFPAISAISLLIALGLSGFARLLRLPPAACHLPSTTFMALLSAAVPFAVIAPHYAPPPELTAAQLAAIPQRLDADFGEIKLLGYDLETQSALPGEAVRLTLYWQAQIQMDRNWSIFVHVVDDQDIIVAQRDRYPGEGTLATTLLRPGQTFADRYVIPIPAAAYSPVAARIEVGLYDLLDGARLPVLGDGDAVALAPLSIRARPGSIPNAVRQNFGNLIQLAGYDLGPRVLRPGETLHVTLYWQALAPIRVNYSVFAHVRGEGETLWAGQDAWPQQGAAPTSTWRVGNVITDPYALILKPDTPPGTYNVEVGLYASSTVTRLRLFADEGRPTDADFLDLSRIRVVTP
jgi:dolichyl-phosphate-mannose-protein mannosyltransferase